MRPLLLLPAAAAVPHRCAPAVHAALARSMQVLLLRMKIIFAEKLVFGADDCNFIAACNVWEHQQPSTTGSSCFGGPPVVCGHLIDAVVPG